VYPILASNAEFNTLELLKIVSPSMHRGFKLLCILYFIIIYIHTEALSLNFEKRDYGTEGSHLHLVAKKMVTYYFSLHLS